MIIQSPSPNFSSSKYKKVGVQLHATIGLMPGTLNWLRNPRSFASAHYLVTKDGTIHQLVQLKDRAWTSGRIGGVSERAKRIMLRTLWGSYVKPGHYLIQIEVECLKGETYTEEQYQSIVELCNQFDFDVTENNLITHRDTYSIKPNLEKERTEILKRLGTINKCDSQPLVLNNWGQLSIKVVEGRIILSKKI